MPVSCVTKQVNMLHQKRMRDSQKVLIPLSIVMIFSGIMAFTGAPSSIWGPNSPIFTTTRHHSTGEHILSWRIKTAPLWVYQGLHALPALIWCLLMPLQHVDRFRRHWPAFHRNNGYIVLCGFLVLSITGYWMLNKKVAHTHDDIWHIHNFSGLIPLGWPTFELTLLALEPLYIYTLLRTVQTARARNFNTHGTWAVLHTMVAYTIAVERVSLLISYVLGLALNFFPKKEVYNFFRLEDTLDAKATAEMDLLALMNLVAFALVVCWGIQEWRKTGSSVKTTEFSPALKDRAKQS
ncbi:fungal transcriptional regulatory protein [Penicillium cinerascens]|uniref:Fungal transcriptional regulatory protein n=1 Tax=Penicillium cinerascens TaxID=70096 RepID=A0A9W9MCI3_9EURO|nr:fungal transcriptional regulatory protein [Penicillium cinerascens]KAJ5195262.1 fungal transcriptional regulatory protein [Penicillium cinerascens]